MCGLLVQAVKGRLLELELGAGDILEARDKARADAAKAEARTQQAEKDAAESRCA
jgi:hypothetical protein